jgi:hypothetical protein
MLRAGAIAVVLSGWLLAGSAFGQGILELSDGRTAVIPSGVGYLAVDFKDASIGARLHRDRKRAGGANCGIPNHQEFAANLSFSAQKGKRALFDKGQFTPGVDLEPGYAFFWEDAIPDCKKVGDIDAPHGYNALYIGVVQSIVGNDVALFSATGVATLETESTKSTSVNVAFNRYFGRGRIIGLSAQAGKEWTSPGDDDPLQTCVQTNSGVDENGKPVTASDCKNRFIGPLQDLRTLKTRVDYLMKIRPIAWKDKPQIGLYTTLSTVSQSGLNTVFNFAVGPTLHPKGKPGQLLGAFLIEARDFSNANGKHPKVKDRWSARLYATLPF